MKNPDYYAWHLCFNQYRKKHSDSKLNTYFSDVEGEMKLKFVIEELYGDVLGEEKMEKLVERLDNTLTAEDIQRMVEAYEDMPNNEVLIINKLKTFARENPDEPISANINETTGLFRLLKKVKSLLGDSAEEEIDYIIEDLNEELKLEGDDIYEEDEWVEDGRYDDLDDDVNFENLDDFDDIIDNSTY